MEPINKPDLNAPRYRKSFHNTFNLEFIKNFRTRFPQYNSLSDKDIKNIIYTFNENVWKTTITNRDGVELPSQIGHIFIGTCPAAKKRYNMDMKTSLDYMLKIKHRNWESDQHVAKIFYTTFGTKYRFRNHELWAFDSARVYSRQVSAEYPEKWKLYVEVDPHRKISTIFRNKNYKRTKEEEEREMLKDYNEFEF